MEDFFRGRVKKDGREVILTFIRNRSRRALRRSNYMVLVHRGLRATCSSTVRCVAGQVRSLDPWPVGVSNESWLLPSRPDHEKISGVQKLVKAYQEEIDALTKRCRASDSAFFSLYKALYEAPDPVQALERYALERPRAAASEVGGRSSLVRGRAPLFPSRFKPDFFEYDSFLEPRRVLSFNQVWFLVLPPKLPRLGPLKLSRLDQTKTSLIWGRRT